MRAAVCEEPRKISIIDVNLPVLNSDEALIKVKAAGISGQDVKAYQGTHPAVIYPIILGNEFSGEVVALGEDVEEVNIGDGVIVEPLFNCGKCPACLAGNYNLCSELVMIGYQTHGSFAEYTIAKASMLHLKDELLSFEEAALIGPLAVAVHAVKRSGISVGDTVVILGAGLFTLQVARKAGAKVIMTDVIDEKLHLAASLGADYVLNADTSDPRELMMAITQDRGADVVMECVGTPQTIAQTVTLVRKGGTIVMVGWTGNESDQMSLTRITTGEISLLGSATYCRDFPTAIELAISGDVNLSSIISHQFELSQVGEALEEISEDQNEIIKAIVSFPEEAEETEYE
jgi:2-desacetyl-2-hydroxyethyl bacteriochlorophyllide A dehydrogenase